MRESRLRLLLLAVAILGTSLVTACASAVPSKSAGQSSRASSRESVAPGRLASAAATPSTGSTPGVIENPFAPVDSSSVVDYGTGLISSPATVLAAPSITLQTALVSAASDTAGLVSGSPDTALRQVSFDPAHGAPIPSGMNDDLRVDSTLAWVIVYRDTPAVVSGPITLPSSEVSKIRASRRCVWLVVVNAATGTGIDNEQICRPSE